MKRATIPSRRNFLKNTGMVIIGFPLLSRCSADATGASEVDAPAGLPAGLSDQPRIDAWLQVLEDGRVRIFTGKIELGQGIRTAVAQVAAEELNTRPGMIEVSLAETGVTPDEGYTAGSRSIESSAMSIRYAAAAAAEVLREQAGRKMAIDPEQLVLQDGRVTTRDGSEALTFAEVLEGRQIEEEVRSPVVLKPEGERRWIGQPVPREGIERMVRGQTWYVQDLRFPGMVHARVVRPKGYASRLESLNGEDLKNNVEGVLKVVQKGSFLGVITEEEYQAVRAREYLKNNTRWSTPRVLPAGESLRDYLKSLPADSQNVENKGRFRTVNPSKTLRAAYFKPYLMHGSIGPSCAVARYENDRLDIWTHSQGVYPLRRSMEALTGLSADRIHIKGVPGSGCYGHNGADDVAADAAFMAMAYPGRHVRLQWMREDEHGWEPYGSAMIMEAQAVLDEEGRIQQWRYDLWSDTHSTRPGGDPASLLAARHLEEPAKMQGSGYRGGAYRNAPPYYNIPTLRIDAHFFEGPLRVSALRSLGAYANIFAIESFMDELAELAGKDPIDFRLMHSDDDRAIAVMKKVREMTAGQRIAENEGLGFAFSRYKNSASYCAVAALVQVDPNQKNVQVRQMWAVIDAGEVINPDGLKNQTEGGMIQSASWTLKEGVQFNETHVDSLDWNSYPIFTYREVPEVEVAIIDRPDQPPLGAGEAAQGPASAAIANAVYRASGQRVRSLPIVAHL